MGLCFVQLCSPFVQSYPFRLGRCSPGQQSRGFFGRGCRNVIAYRRRIDSLQEYRTPRASVYDEVKAVLSLSKVVTDAVDEEGGRIWRSPSSLMVCCPFHEDTTPSMSVSDAKGLFKCFGCGVSGNLFSFEMKRKNLTSTWAAVKSLAERYPEVKALVGDGNSGPEGEVNIRKSRVPPIERKVRRNRKSTIMRERRAREVCKCAAEYFVRELLETDRDDTNAAMDYLEVGRKLSYKTIEEFNIGWADNKRLSLVNYLTRERGFSHDDVIDAGLAMRGKDGGVWDRFRNRVIIPIRDECGDIVGFGGRLLTDSKIEHMPKYLNSPETPIFRKSKILFGADKLLRDLQRYRAGVAKRKKEFDELPHSLTHDVKPDFIDPEGIENDAVILVEGYMDVISLYNASGGSILAVASLGTAVSRHQLTLATKLIKDLCAGHVILCLDNDTAGIAASSRICDDILPNLVDNFRFKCAVLPPAVKDVDEFLSKGYGTAEEFEAQIKESAQNWIFWRGLQLAEAERAKFLENHDMNNFRFPLDADGIPEVTVSNEVLDSLSTFLSKVLLTPAQFEIPLFVHKWAEILCLGVKQRIKSVSQTIIRLSEKKLSVPIPDPPSSVGGKSDLPSLSVLSQYPGYYWYFSAEPPWEILRKKPRLKRVYDVHGIAGLAASVTLDEYLSRKRRPMIEKKLQYEASYFLPLKERRRKRGDPHEMGEQIILRALIRCSYTQRIEALDELLTIVVRCADENLGFWTKEEYLCLFNYLSGLQAEWDVQEMAAQIEQEPWFTVDIEDLFEEHEDPEMQEVFAELMKDPVELVTTAAEAIEKLEKHSVKASNINELGDLMQKHLTSSEEGEMTQAETLSKIEELASSLQFDYDVMEGLKTRSEEEERAEIIAWTQSSSWGFPAESKKDGESVPAQADESPLDQSLSDTSGGEFQSN